MALTPTTEAPAQKASNASKPKLTRGVLPAGTTIRGILARRLCESSFAIGDTMSARLGPTMWDVQDWPRGLKRLSAVVERVPVADTAHPGRRFVLAIREARVNGVLRRDVPVRFRMEPESGDGQRTLGGCCYDEGEIFGDLRRSVRF